MTIARSYPFGGNAPFLPTNGGSGMTEEKSRLDFLKSIEIDKTFYLAMQEIEFIIGTMAIVRNSLKDEHNKDWTGLQCLDGYNFKDSYIKAVAKVWNIVFGDKDHAIKIFLHTDSINNNINPNAIVMMKEMVLEDIKTNPIEWVDFPKIDGLARYYLEKAEKQCPF